MINILKKNKIVSGEHISIRKGKHQMIKILAKLQSWNLPKFKFENLFKFKKSIKVKNISIISKSNFLILNTKIKFAKLN